MLMAGLPTLKNVSNIAGEFPNVLSGDIKDQETAFYWPWPISPHFLYLLMGLSRICQHQTMHHAVKIFLNQDAPLLGLQEVGGSIRQSSPMSANPSLTTSPQMKQMLPVSR